jgi:predicted RecA/RadA family phage recombinase
MAKSSSLPKISAEEIRMPKKPKLSASLTALDNYISRYKSWVQKVKHMAAEGRRKDAVKKKISSL